MRLSELATHLSVLEKVDNSEFQRRARVLQAIWREERGMECGIHVGSRGSRPLGSRLPMPWAKDTLANYLTDRIREVVKNEVCDPKASAGKLFMKPRIFDDLLSSQPLCFNLFGELKNDLRPLSAVVSDLTGGRFSEVTSVEFEYSPGRGNPRYLDDRSAFDVFLRCQTASGGKGFIGIEVKYHENLKGKASEHKPRYDQVATKMGCFPADHGLFKVSPMQQIWRDHLLSGITRSADRYNDGVFVILHPKDNPHVLAALSNYQTLLKKSDSFASWTMEDFVGRLRRHSRARWIGDFQDRYLAFEKIDRRLARSDVV